VTARRILHLLVLAGLVLAPFGRLGLAHAHAAPAAMAAHCAGNAAPISDRSESQAVNCMIACAAMAPVSAILPAPPAAARSQPVAMPLFLRAGLTPGAEPPPPRLS
jgi:hypothetical protein